MYRLHHGRHSPAASLLPAGCQAARFTHNHKQYDHVYTEPVWEVRSEADDAPLRGTNSTTGIVQYGVPCSELGGKHQTYSCTCILYIYISYIANIYHIYCSIIYIYIYRMYTGRIQESTCIIRLLALFHPRFRIVPARLTLKEFLHLCFAHWKAVFNGNHVWRFVLGLVPVVEVFLDLGLVRRHGWDATWCHCYAGLTQMQDLLRRRIIVATHSTTYLPVLEVYA